MQIQYDRLKRIYLVLHTKRFSLQRSQSHLILSYPNSNPSPNPNRNRRLAVMT